MRVKRSLKNIPFIFVLSFIGFGLWAPMVLLNGCSGNGNNPSGPVTIYQPVTILATATFTPTGSSTPTSTITLSPTSTDTPVTIIVTPTYSFTPTNSSTPTCTTTPTNSPTPTFTSTPTSTFSPTNSFTPASTNTSTATSTPTSTATSTSTSTRTNTPTITRTPTNTGTPTNTFTPTMQATPVETNFWQISGGAGTAWGMAVTNSTVYAADFNYGTVHEFNLAGTPVPSSTWATPSVAYPVGVAVDGSGNVYVTSYKSTGHITEFNAHATPVATWYNGVSFGNLAYDGSSNLYAVNSTANSILTTTTAGVSVSSFAVPLVPNAWGMGLAGTTILVGSSNQGGNLTTYNLSGSQLPVSLVQPFGPTLGVDAIAVDSTGRIYIGTGNWGSGPIMRFSPTGAFQTQWGNFTCFGMAFDASGNLYVGDLNTGGIYVFKP